MEQEFADNGSQLNCLTSDKDKLQKTEVSFEVKHLKNQVKRFSTRLTECRNQIHNLKCNLDLIEEIIIRREVGEDPQDPRGCDTILKLPTQIRGLQTHLKLLEDSETPPTTPSEESKRKRLHAERKALWRMELERRQAREGVIREMNPIAIECIEIKKKLDVEKARFRNLNKWVPMLREELQNRRHKSEENKNLIGTFHKMENKLSETRTEICKLLERIRDPEVESRDNKLTGEISALRDQIKSIKEKKENNSDAMKYLNRKHKDIKEIFDSENWHLDQNAITYNDDLKQADYSLKDLADIHDHIENLKGEKSELVLEFENLIESVLSHNQEKDQSSSLSKFNQECNDMAPTSTEKKNENVAGDTEVIEQETQRKDYTPPQVEKLMIECVKYRALIEAATNESDLLSYLTKLQKTHLRDITRKLEKTRRLLTGKSEEKKHLQDKTHKTPSYLKRSDKEINIDLRVYIGELREENKFFRFVLRKIVESEIQNTHLCKTFMKDSKAFFENALQKVKDVSTVLSLKRNRESVKQICY